MDKVGEVELLVLLVVPGYCTCLINVDIRRIFAESDATDDVFHEGGEAGGEIDGERAWLSGPTGGFRHDSGRETVEEAAELVGDDREMEVVDAARVEDMGGVGFAGEAPFGAVRRGEGHLVSAVEEASGGFAGWAAGEGAVVGGQDLASSIGAGDDDGGGGGVAEEEDGAVASGEQGQGAMREAEKRVADEREGDGAGWQLPAAPACKP